jgi:hypothetical protein
MNCMQVQAPSLVAQLAERGARTALVADTPLVARCRPSLAEVRPFEERREKVDRDIYARSSALAWLDDRSLDAVITLIIDTDGIAHREGIQMAAYAGKIALLVFLYAAAVLAAACAVGRLPRRAALGVTAGVA